MLPPREQTGSPWSYELFTTAQVGVIVQQNFLVLAEVRDQVPTRERYQIVWGSSSQKLKSWTEENVNLISTRRGCSRASKTSRTTSTIISILCTKKLGFVFDSETNLFRLKFDFERRLVFWQPRMGLGGIGPVLLHSKCEKKVPQEQTSTVSKQQFL